MLVYSGKDHQSCYKCKERKLGCHANCEKYISDCEKAKEKKEIWLRNKTKYCINKKRKTRNQNPFHHDYV